MSHLPLTHYDTNTFCQGVGWNCVGREANIYKLCNTLNINNLGGGYCAANNPFHLLIQNLFRCFHKVSESVAELIKSVRSCQNSWKNGQFSQEIMRYVLKSVPLWKNIFRINKNQQNNEKNSFILRSHVLHDGG